MLKPPNGMHADERAGALAVQVQVAAEELALAAREALAVARVERAGQAVLGVVGDGDALVEVLDREDREHGPKISSRARRAPRLRRRPRSSASRRNRRSGPGSPPATISPLLAAEVDVLEDLLLRAAR